MSASLQQLLTAFILAFSSLLLCIRDANCIDHAHLTRPLTFSQSSSHGDLNCTKAFAGKGKPTYGGRAHAGLVHRYGPCSPDKELSHLSADTASLALHLLKKDQERLMFKKGPLPRDVIERSLATSTSSSALGTVISNFLLNVGLGTPTKEFFLILDTGSNLAWTQCPPCDSPTSCFQQASPFFDPTTSSSYVPLSCATTTCTLCSTSGMCQFNISYGDGSHTSGDLAEDTFTIGSATIQNYIFGCGHSSQGTFKDSVDGILGLGWGEHSLVDQSVSFFDGAFAYCLPSIFSSASATGFIEFGIEAVVNTSGGSSITPMIHNVNMQHFYFVWLKGISVGGVPLSLASIPSIPATSTDTSGTFVDSGTVITRLPANDIVTLRNAFLAGSTDITLVSAQTNGVLDTCFQFNSDSQIPLVTFHFDGFDFTLTSENIVYPTDPSTNTVCLAFAALPPTLTNGQFIIIGYHQMAGFLVTFDTIDSQLGILTSSKVC